MTSPPPEVLRLKRKLSGIINSDLIAQWQFFCIFQLSRSLKALSPEDAFWSESADGFVFRTQTAQSEASNLGISSL